MKLLYTIFQDVFKSETLLYVVLTAILLCPAYQHLSSDLTDTNKLEMLRVAKENANTVCVIEPDIYMENFMELSKYQDIYVTDIEQSLLSNSLIQDNDQFILYLPDDIDVDNIYRMIQEKKPAISGYDRLYVGYRTTVYKYY